jgi:hypothetical protein
MLGEMRIIVKAVLFKELRMSCRTKKRVAYKIFGPIERTPVQQIVEALDRYSSLSMHGQICLAVNALLFRGVRRIFPMV